MLKQLLLSCLLFINIYNTNAQVVKDTTDLNSYLKSVKWRCIGPFRGGRSNCATGVVGNSAVYYQGTTGG